MKCSRMMFALGLGAAALPLLLWLYSWMFTLVDRHDPTSVIGFVGWAAFFFYLTLKGIFAIVGLSVDKTLGVK